MRDNNKGRRRFLQSVALAGTAGIAGCMGQQGGGQNGSGQNNSGPNLQKPTPAEGQQGNYEPIGPIQWIGISRDTSASRFTLQSLAKEDLQKLGLDFNLKPKPLSALGNNWTNSNFDFLTLWWAATPDKLDPHFKLYFNFHSKYATDGENRIKYTNPEYDKAVEKFISTMDEKKRQKHAYKCQSILARDQPYAFLTHADFMAAGNKNMFSNWTEQVSSYTYWNLANLPKLKPVGGQKTAIYATGTDPGAVNPMAGEGNKFQQVTKLIYGRLARWDAEGNSVPRDAKEINVVNDTTVEAVLKQDLSFHDGEPFTAEDVKFTIQYYKKWGQPYLSAYYDVIKNVEIINKNTVRFNLTQPMYAFTNVILSEMNMLPKHIWEGVPKKHNLEHPRQWKNPDFTGSGPFKLTNFEPQNQLTYEPHDGYPGMSFKFEQLIWDIYGSGSAAYSDVQQGNAAFVHELLPGQYQSAKNSSNLVAGSKPGFDATSIFMHNKRKPMSDRVFRQACSHAVNKQRLIKAVYRGNATPANQPVAPVNKFWHNPNLPSYDGGLKKAHNLLKNAGYRWDKNGKLLMPKKRFNTKN